MAHTKVDIALTITLQTPLSVGAGGSSGSRADKSIVRDGYGRPVIPGSHVKGRVRHAAEAILRSLELAVPEHFDDTNANIITALFGSAYHRSPFEFSDLTGFIKSDDQQVPIQEKDNTRYPLRPSVSLNRRRMVAEDARLLLQETTLGGMTFYAASAISGVLLESNWNDQYLPIPHAHHHMPCVALLWAAIKMATRWGGAKSRGLGWADIAVVIKVDGAEFSETTLEQELAKLPDVQVEPKKEVTQ